VKLECDDYCQKSESPNELRGKRRGPRNREPTCALGGGRPFTFPSITKGGPALVAKDETWKAWIGQKKRREKAALRGYAGFLAR